MAKTGGGTGFGFGCQDRILRYTPTHRNEFMSNKLSVINDRDGLRAQFIELLNELEGDIMGL